MKKVAYIIILIAIIVPCSVVAYNYLFPFEPIEVHEIADEPLDILAVDINSDDLEDIVTAHRSGHGVSIFLNNEDGTLTFHDFIDTEKGATSVTAGNFNDDNFLDLAVTACNRGCTDNGIQLIFGDGRGNFELGPYADIEGVPYNLTAVDLDQDGLDDLIASDYPNQVVHVLWSNETPGSFTQVQLKAGNKTIDLQAGDFNNDFKPDIIAINQGAGTASIYLNLGDRYFEPQIDLDTNILPYSLAIADLDHDNNLDIVIAHSSEPSKISIYSGTGDGDFELSKLIETSGRLIYVAVDDFNRDGEFDIIATRERGGQASLLLASDALTFEEELKIPAGNAIYSADLTRLNKDKYLDLVDIDFDTNILTVSLGQHPNNYRSK